MTRLPKTLRCLIAVPALLLAWHSSHAALVTYDAGNQLQSITDLTITTYGDFDVTFSSQSFDSIWGGIASPSPEPEFWGNNQGAIDARGAMQAAVAASLPAGNPSLQYVFLPRGTAFGFVDVTAFSYDSTQTITGGTGLVSASNSPPQYESARQGVWAIVAPAGGTVPTPSTLLLAAPLLGALITARRRRKTSLS